MGSKRLLQTSGDTMIYSILVLAVLHIVLDVKQKHYAMYVTKPVTMLLIIAFGYTHGPQPVTPYGMVIGVGLLLSLVGDIFLMLKSEQFVAGLVSFLLAHIAYIVAFVGIGVKPDLWWSLLLVSLAAIYLGYLWNHLGNLKIPVLLYFCVIIMMGVCASGISAAEHSSLAWYAKGGAFLFIFSDACLALGKFKKPLPYSPVFIMGSYFSAQWCLAYSTLFF